MRRRPRFGRAGLVGRAGAVVALAVLSAGLVGCSDQQGTEGKNYVSGDSQVVEIKPADRGDPVQASGETVDGGQLDLADYRGHPLVVNVWGSWCPDCRAEMPTLVDASDELAGGASLVGINIRESSIDNPRAYERTAKMTFPSIYDPGSQQLVKFPEPLNPRATPTTVVLDSQGRLAALIPGKLPSKLTLVEVVRRVVEEEAEGDTGDTGG